MLYCWACAELGLLHSHTPSTHASSVFPTLRMNDPPEGVAVRPAIPQRRTATDPRQPAPKTHRNSSDRRPLAPLPQLYPTIRRAETPFPGMRTEKDTAGAGLCRLGKLCLSSHPSRSQTQAACGYGTQNGTRRNTDSADSRGLWRLGLGSERPQLGWIDDDVADTL